MQPGQQCVQSVTLRRASSSTASAAAAVAVSSLRHCCKVAQHVGTHSSRGLYSEQLAGPQQAGRQTSVHLCCEKQPCGRVCWQCMQPLLKSAQPARAQVYVP
eukprot:14870-Heterococcus_DN1.PRE.1